MELGAFSISLPVHDLAASRRFYEQLGFEYTGGDDEEGYAILKHGDAIVGLFHGHIERPMLTFNPGLTVRMETLDDFTDVRDIQAALRSAGLELTADTDPEGTGPAHIALSDPDGHPILIDQFAPRPGSQSS